MKKRRRLLCPPVVDEQEWSLSEAAAAAEVSERTASKCLRRFRDEGEAGLLPARRPRTVFKNRKPERRIEAIAALRGGCASRAPRSPSCCGCRGRRCRGSCAGSGSVAAVG